MVRRNTRVFMKCTPEEVARMEQKMAELGIRNRSAYLRKMALDGYCVNLDLSDMKEMVSLLRYCSNNLNQYAKKANETGSVYREDIQDLQVRLDGIWMDCKEILAILASVIVRGGICCRTAIHGVGYLVAVF